MILRELHEIPTKRNLKTIQFSFATKLLHTIEAFRVKTGDFFSTVSKFHLPCVRSYMTQDENDKSKLIINTMKGSHL